MFHAAMAVEIDGARTLARMDELSRQVWQGHGSGALADEEAQALAERLHARRSAIREGIVPVGIPAGRLSLFPPRRTVTSPDKTVSRDRRRLLAASGPMPPALASRFTTGQLAVLRIVADEIAVKGVCGLCIDAIAARAGVCRRLAQGAIRLAEGDGLLTIEERRHQGRKNSPNLIRIISREWLGWMRRAGRAKAGGSGCKALHPTDTEVFNSGKTEASGPLRKLPTRQGRSYVGDLRPSSRVAERAKAMP